jgi:hypothetical protein
MMEVSEQRELFHMPAIPRQPVEPFPESRGVVARIPYFRGELPSSNTHESNQGLPMFPMPPLPASPVSELMPDPAIFGKLWKSEKQ